MANGCRTTAPEHNFDPASGWCANNCGKRSDGRIVIHGDEKHPGREYTPQQLHDLLTKANT